MVEEVGLWDMGERVELGQRAEMEFAEAEWEWGGGARGDDFGRGEGFEDVV